ncbi:RNA-binding protein 41 [Megalops cyprinoides]|uniref:RNA-binding protein 41 n=1 Tax=Megalops cyprinoides TaxID=118141 RepID=UPI0018649590|nr:RNA-binding protein 41 [Megalops cyprinoides]
MRRWFTGVEIIQWLPESNRSCCADLSLNVTRRSCEDAPIPEEQETEGQRQLHSLLLQQLDTEADLSRCVAKKKCFAPAALYKPFGEQAAGVRSLSQFRALQDKEQELAGLRELGLTDAEIELWRSRDTPEAGEKSRGVCAAPGARHQRLQIIRDKIEAREQLLSRPQRLSASRPLSRREMEIERALFQGSDRLNFLSALYHQEDDSKSSSKGPSSTDPLDLLYRDVLRDQKPGTASLSDETETGTPESTLVTQPQPKTDPDRRQSPHGHSDHRDSDSQTQSNTDVGSIGCHNKDSHQSVEAQNALGNARPQDQGGTTRLVSQSKISASQPIRSLCSVARQGTGGPLTVSGLVEQIPEEEIRANRETEEEIRCIPRFQNYQRGEPSKVLCVKNLSPRASLAQLVSLFSRFQQPDGPSVLYRLLTGRLKGQAFITFSDVETAQAALELVNGYRLLDKPLVIEFGRQRQDGEKDKGTESSHAGHSSESTEPRQGKLQERGQALLSVPQGTCREESEKSPLKDFNGSS